MVMVASRRYGEIRLHEIVVAAVRGRDDKLIVMERRSDDRHYPGLFNGLTEHKEQGERTYRQTILRGLDEELGISDILAASKDRWAPRICSMGYTSLHAPDISITNLGGFNRILPITVKTGDTIDKIMGRVKARMYLVNVPSLSSADVTNSEHARVLDMSLQEVGDSLQKFTNPDQVFFMINRGFLNSVQ